MGELLRTCLILMILIVPCQASAWSSCHASGGGCSGQTFGVTDTTDFDRTGGVANGCWLTKITGACASNIASISANACYIGTGAGDPATWVIYADSAGSPTGSPVAYKALAQAEGSCPSVLTEPWSVNPGAATYWIGICLSSGSDNLVVSNWTGGQGWSGSVSAYATPGTLSGGASSTAKFEIKVTYP